MDVKHHYIVDRFFEAKERALSSGYFIPATTLLTQVVRVGEYLLPLLVSPQSMVVPIGLEYRFRVLVPLYLALLEGAVHSIIVGPTGRGKTTLLAWLVVVTYLHGYKVVVVDPKGDLSSYIEPYIKDSIGVLSSRIIELKDLKDVNSVILGKPPSSVKSNSLSTIVIVDEAWQVDLRSIDKIMRIGRSLGVSLVVSSQYPEDFHPRMWINSANAVVFGSPSKEYAENVMRYISLRPEDSKSLSTLSTGEALVLYRWAHRPLIARIFNPAILLKHGNSRNIIGMDGSR